MVSVLVHRSSGPGSSPGRGHCAVFLGKKLTLTMPLSTQEYKPSKLRGSDLRWTSIPSRGSKNIANRFMLQKLG